MCAYLQSSLFPSKFPFYELISSLGREFKLPDYFAYAQTYREPVLSRVCKSNDMHCIKIRGRESNVRVLLAVLDGVSVAVQLMPVT